MLLNEVIKKVTKVFYSFYETPMQTQILIILSKIRLCFILIGTV